MNNTEYADDSNYDERYPVVEPTFNKYLTSVDLCYKIVQFLLDLPYLKSNGELSQPYETGCRADLIKYIYYDDGNPLVHPLPSVEQKQKLIFNPSAPQSPPLKSKGYRIFAQSKIVDIQNDSKTELRVYPLMVTPTNPHIGDLLIAFECWSNMDYKQICGFQDRTYNMAVCILSALNGRNITGVGSMFFDRQNNSNCVLSSVLSDNRYNLGHRLIMGVNIAK